MKLLELFEPYLFLELGNKLIDDDTYDKLSRSRTVVNRAYYAAFLTAKKKIQDFGISLREVKRIHRDTIETLQRYDSGLASKLNTLFDHRVDADYKMEMSIPLTLARLCLRFSEHIIIRINSLEK